MKVQRFVSEEHWQFIASWLRERGCSDDDGLDLPEIGYISFSEDVPVAVAFLRRCEGRHGILEGLVSNPYASSLERHLGIDLAVREVILCARRLKLKEIIAYSKDDGTLERSLNHGFLKLPHTLIGLNLEVQDGFYRVAAIE